ncbi:hypothetical protein BIY22_06105 [Vibrio panuliri]|uniref:RNA polymerase sigma-70 ECF-like HTH domain-containing protein n=1 Tax=Vibrio panuliri TaxID=1381081 RepID=A0A1Q9HJR3_9VIBR|nr:hypothetical protein BIY22_06105 [Vibrio panuliri]
MNNDWQADNLLWFGLITEIVNKTQHRCCCFLCSSSSIASLYETLENIVSLYDIEHATKLLMGWQSRDKDASQELFHHVYDDIKAVIANLMQTQRPTDTLLRESSVTELANESIVKLHRWRHDEAPMESRRDFFEYVRVSVWHLLFGKAHHNLVMLSSSEQLLDQLEEAIPAEFTSQHELNRDLYIALEEMRARYPRQFEVFELKHFSTASITDIAELKGVSKRTVDNDLKFAQVWLQKKLS